MFRTGKIVGECVILLEKLAILIPAQYIQLMCAGGTNKGGDKGEEQGFLAIYPHLTIVPGA